MTPVESAATLKDGTIARIRAIRPEDEQILIESFRRLSPESVYQRFFMALPELPAQMAHHVANASDSDRFALVAEIGAELAAVARYERTSESSAAELALVVLDAWQNRGLGRLMIRAIVDAAERNGI